MKRKLILSAAGVVLLAASVTTLVSANKSNDPMDDLFRANVEALARNEVGPVCTGPKRENIGGNIFCRSENTSPCQDMYGCD